MFVGKFTPAFVRGNALDRAAEAEAAIDYTSNNDSPEVMAANHFALLAAESFNWLARMAEGAESITMTRRDFVYLTTPWKPGAVK